MKVELGAPVILRLDQPDIWHLPADVKRTLDHFEVSFDDALRTFASRWPTLCDPAADEVWVYGDLVRQRRLCERCAHLNGDAPHVIPPSERAAIAVEHPTLETRQTLEELELNVIGPAPDNPRKQLGDIDELAASMVELGMLQPLVVTPRLGKFMVVCGHRRYAAAKKARLKTAPAIIRDLDEPQRIKAMLIENCQRADLSTLEEARAHQRLVELGLSQRQIAGDVGKGQSHVSKRLALLELPEKVIDQVDSGGITIAEALELVALRDHPKRLDRVVNRPGWQTVAYAIAQEQAAIKLQATVAEAKNKLQAKGITPAKLGPYGDAKPPAKRLGLGWNCLNIGVKEHEKLDCHAIGINPQSGALVALCTKPENHPEANSDHHTIGGARKLTAAEKREEKELRELEATGERRLAFIESIANGKVTKDDLLELSLFALFAVDFWEPFGWACRMLSVPMPGPIVEAREAEAEEQAAAALEKDRYVDLEPSDAEPALAEYSSQSAANRLRAAFALAACVIEENECRSRWNPWGAGAIALFTVLERHGYKPARIENKKLAEARKSRPT